MNYETLKLLIGSEFMCMNDEHAICPRGSRIVLDSVIADKVFFSDTLGMDALQFIEDLKVGKFWITKIA